MAWIDYKRTRIHSCEPLPLIRNYPLGHIIICDICELKYQSTLVSQYGESWVQWRRVI